MKHRNKKKTVSLKNVLLIESHEKKRLEIQNEFNKPDIDFNIIIICLSLHELSVIYIVYIVLYFSLGLL
jgi:hypothetical protein